MKYKVGDKVRVTNNLKCMSILDKSYYDVVQEMIKFAGEIVTIDGVIPDIDGNIDHVTFEEDEYKYLWDTDLLELVKDASLINELAKTKNRMKCIEEDNEILKEKLRQKNNEYEMLKEYYNKISFSLNEAAYLTQENEHLLDKLASTGKRMADLEKDNMELRKRCSVLEGKLNRAKSIIGMLTGREF